MRLLASAIAATTLFASSVLADVPPIVVKGSKFFYSNNGTQFFIKGVAYQQDVGTNGSTLDTGAGAEPTSFSDPLADAKGCARDLPLLAGLGANALRVYAVDPTQDHDSCMNAFANAGIYLIIDLSQPTVSINRNDPQWNDDLYTRYTSVVDTFQKYNNVIGFFTGNEVANSVQTTNSTSFVKAAVRDMKAYVKAKKYRSLYFGYATSDDPDIRTEIAAYFDCGDSASAVDFWGYNIYSWCGDSSFQKSGYADRTKEFATYNVPYFFAEYGCNTVQPRKFTEVAALYGPDMNTQWSGGFVYMWFQEVNDYGLVKVSGDSVSTLSDYNAFSSQIKSATPTGVNSNSYNPTITAAQACPSVGQDWAAAASPLPPTPDENLCECMVKSLSCVVAEKTTQEMYGDLFNEVCGFGADNCAGFNVSPTDGKYGAYSMCNSKQQLSWAFNQYFLAQNQAADACSFGGNATAQTAQEPSGACKAQVSQAGAAGTGTVSSGPAATSKGAASMTTVPDFQWGFLQIGTYLFVAGMAGVTMILL